MATVGNAVGMTVIVSVTIMIMTMMMMMLDVDDDDGDDDDFCDCDAGDDGDGDDAVVDDDVDGTFDGSADSDDDDDGVDAVGAGSAMLTMNLMVVRPIVLMQVLLKKSSMVLAAMATAALQMLSINHWCRCWCCLSFLSLLLMMTTATPNAEILRTMTSSVLAGFGVVTMVMTIPTITMPISLIRVILPLMATAQCHLFPCWYLSFPHIDTHKASIPKTS